MIWSMLSQCFSFKCSWYIDLVLCSIAKVVIIPIGFTSSTAFSSLVLNIHLSNMISRRLYLSTSTSLLIALISWSCQKVRMHCWICLIAKRILQNCLCVIFKPQKCTFMLSGERDHATANLLTMFLLNGKHLYSLRMYTNSFSRQS